MAKIPVPFKLFECFAKNLNTSVEKLDGINVDGAICGINGVTAINFCNWLTKEYAPKNGGYHFALPTVDDLRKLAPKTKEWAIIDKPGDSTPVSIMCYYDQNLKDDNSIPFSIHALNSDKTVTFRIKLEKSDK